MATRIAPAERLLDLVIALTRTRGMTKADIRDSVAGYGDARSDDSFNRMFERDKELLRDLGMPIETEADAWDETEIRYHIDPATYEAVEIGLEPRDLAVVASAAEVWRGAWRDRAARAVTKLRAQSDSDLAAADGPFVHLGEAADWLDTLLVAIRERRVVRFDYVAASTAQRTSRIVEPWRVIGRGRAWYLLGFDQTRGAARAFRLDRVAGTLALGEHSEAFLPPSPDEVEAALAMQHPGERREAHIAAQPGQANLLRSVTLASTRLDDGRDDLLIVFTDLAETAGRLAALGAAVEVLEPADLRGEVIRRLREVARG